MVNQWLENLKDDKELYMGLGIIAGFPFLLIVSFLVIGFLQPIQQTSQKVKMVQEQTLSP